MDISSVITIDGPASSGKSSIGLSFASEIHYQFIDAGSIYRAITLYVLDNKLDIKNISYVLSSLKSINIEFALGNNSVQTYLNGEDVSNLLHSQRVSEFVPHIGATSQIRELVRKKQIDLTVGKRTVMTGRDIGSLVFPDAELKYYITATLEVRAKRRHLQLIQNGIDIDLETIKKDIELRDQKDLTRFVSPLVIPKNAFVIDTTSLTIEETLKNMLEIYDKTFNVSNKIPNEHNIKSEISK